MAATDFDTTLPSIRLLQKWIKEKAAVEFKLMSGDVITGTVFWQDSNCVCILDANNQQITIWKMALAYMKAHN